MNIFLFVSLSLFLLVIAFLLRVWYVMPKAYKNLSVNEFKEQIKRYAKILTKNGLIHVVPNFSRVPFSIRKRTFKRKPAIFELRFTAGEHSRKTLQMMLEQIEGPDYDIKILIE